MNRRSFLQRAGFVVAGTALGSAQFPLRLKAESVEPQQSIVSTGQNKDYDALVKTVLEPLGGMSAFVKSGQRVVIKPNIGWDRTPEQAATTHPEIVKSLVQMALAAGAAKVMVFDRTCNESRLCYAHSGIQSILESMKDPRVECSFIDDRKFVPVKIARGKSVSEWEFYKDALESDVYINVPVAKQHGLSKLTLGLKNIMGVIGGVRGKIHMSIGQRLADLNTIIPSRLTVIDATRILLRNGPQGGNLDDVKVTHTLIASTDIVAADAYATTLFEMEPAEIGSTVAANQMGLGEMDLSKIKLIKT